MGSAFEIISVSLGSSARDHHANFRLAGRSFRISRIGTNGDLKRFLALLREYDGRVDALSIGGTDFYLLVGRRRYYFQTTKLIKSMVERSRLADGNGIKHIMGARAVALLRSLGLAPGGATVLLTSAVDMYGMARAFVENGYDTSFADLLVGLHLPVLLKRLGSLRGTAALILPFLTRLPLQWFYPLGDEQLEIKENIPEAFKKADIIAGDFHQIRRNLPSDLKNKIIITNTTTSSDLELLRGRGLNALITTTPRINGRSFGTNVMEAVCRCLIEKDDRRISGRDFMTIIDTLALAPELTILNKGTVTHGRH
jgi:hypothetical protein